MILFLRHNNCIAICNSTALFYIGNNNCENIYVAFILLNNYSLLIICVFSKEHYTKCKCDLFTRIYIIFYHIQ